MRKRRNLLTLVNYTTITPFEWHKKYICFYCGKKHTDYNQLTKHTRTHDLYDETLIKTKSGIVKLDVSSINCELCDECFNNLNSTILHLMNAHNLSFDTEVRMNIGLYRLKDLVCLICEKIYEDFRRLVRHCKYEHDGRTFTSKLYDSSLNIVKNVSDNNVQYICKQCNRKFDNIVTLRKHKSDAHEQNEKSNIANKVTNNIKCVLRFTTAVPVKCNKNTFMCTYCSKTFVSYAEMRDHVVGEHKLVNAEQDLPVADDKLITIKIDITSLSCRLCEKRFDGFYEIIDHLIQIHEADYDKSHVLQTFKLTKKGMKCGQCEKQFTYYNHLVTHMNRDHLEDLFLCACCGKKFVKKLALTQHITKYHSMKANKCKICDLHLGTNHKLKAHMVKVHKQLFSCTKCDEQFKTHYIKQKHLLRVHNIGHQCSICNLKFVKNSFMINHMRKIHLKEREVECTVCGKKFFSISQMKTHMVKHTRERNYQCDLCHKGFLWKRNLNNHKRLVHLKNIDRSGKENLK